MNIARSRKPSLRSVEQRFEAPTTNTAKRTGKNLFFLLVGGGGFEPPKSETSDLQSDAFGHSAIRPYLVFYPVRQRRGK